MARCVWRVQLLILASMVVGGCAGGATYQVLVPDAIVTTAPPEWVADARRETYQALGRYAGAGTDHTYDEASRWWAGRDKPASEQQLIRTKVAFEAKSGTVIRIESVGGRGLRTVVFIEAARQEDRLAALNKIVENLAMRGATRSD